MGPADTLTVQRILHLNVVWRFVAGVIYNLTLLCSVGGGCVKVIEFH